MTKNQLEKPVQAAIEKGQKIQAIKLLRELRGIGLKEASDIVESYTSENSDNTGIKKLEAGNKFNLKIIVIVGAVVYLVYSGQLDALKTVFLTLFDLPKESTEKPVDSMAKNLIAFSDADKNKIRNSRFDSGLPPWFSSRDANSFFYVSDEGGQQKGAVRVKTISPENPQKRMIYEAIMSQCVKLNDGISYRFSANFKPNGEYLSQYTNRINLIWYQEEDCSARGQFGAYLEPRVGEKNWHTIKRQVVRSLNAKAVRIDIVQNKLSANNVSALWDDIALVPTEFKKNSRQLDVEQYSLSVGENYLKNADFASDLQHWRFTGDTTWVNEAGINGSGAVRLAIFSDRGGYGAHGFSQCINLGLPRVFSFGAKVRVDPLSTYQGGGIFRLSWYEDLDCRGRSQAGFKEDRVDDIDGWQSIGVDEVVAPDNASSARLYFTRGIKDSGTFAYFVDDVFFRAK